MKEFMRILQSHMDSSCVCFPDQTVPKVAEVLSESACAVEHAELIFCPYNYLLDPVIRRAVQVDVEDAVLILDEAHNIEDICRCACDRALVCLYRPL